MVKAEKSGSRIHLGEIRTSIVGLQYYDNTVSPGLRVHLEREPDNPHDSYAVRVDGEQGEPLGHIPRRTAAWIAPLLDAGMVRLLGRIPESTPGSSEDYASTAPLVLQVELAPKGRGIIKIRRGQPRDANEVIHRMLLGVYRQSGTWKDPDMVSSLLHRLSGLNEYECLPETRLLLALMQSRPLEIAGRVARRQKQKVLIALKKIRLGKAVHFRDLTVFPLFQKNGHEPQYMLLSQALEQEAAEVSEVSDSGEVPELMLVNRATQPILAPEGEIVVGGKQNRTINITILVAAASRVRLPVSCVEQGRWDHGAGKFKTSHYATPGLRACKLESAQRNFAVDGAFRSDQGRVWEDVACCLSQAGIRSETESLTDGYEQSAEQLREYCEKIKLPATACGALCMRGSEVIGLDLFDHHLVFSEVWPRLLESYAFTVTLGRKPPAASAPAATAKSARNFLREAFATLEPVTREFGLGSTFNLAAPGITGSVLWYKDRVCHAGVFPA